MNVNLKQFLNDANFKDEVYPGKRVVKPCQHSGEFKNHCVVIDWRDPETLKVDIRPGLSGKQLAPEIIKQYPVCFQMPTSVTIKVTNDNDEEESDEEEKGKSGKSGGGGKKPARKKLEDIELISARFEKSADGSIPSLGEIKEMVVMGLQIAKESFGNAFAELTKQIGHAKISVTDVLAKAADVVTRVTPPQYVTPKGDETAQYKYDREKNANIGMKMTMG
ncbi:MAG: hypothetical protein ACRBDI_03985 [Alphaproteobacteria bacterium]